jgi:hypothetical protein
MNLALMPNVSMSVDSSTIQTAVGLALKSTSRKMELLLADTAFYTAVYAAAYTPYTELSTIDEEMEVTATSIISQGYKGQTNITSNKKTPFTLTVAQKIVLARMNPNSAYNIQTSGRWRIPYQNLRGIGGFRILEEMAERMIRARHSSTHFLQSGWKGVFKKIKALGLRASVAQGLPEGSQIENPLNTMSDSKVEALGDVQRGGVGTPQQWIRIENLIGMESKYPMLAQEHNEALLTYGTPALQRGMDEQAQDMRDHYLPKVGAELAAEWNAIPDAPKLASVTRTNMVRMAEKQSVFDVEIGQDLTTFSNL